MPFDQRTADVSDECRAADAIDHGDVWHEEHLPLEVAAAQGPVRQVGRKPYQIIAPGAAAQHARFEALIPIRPYCTDDPSSGVQIRSRKSALSRKHIQYNGPNAISWLAFDVDRPDARFAAEDAYLPPPTVFVGNPLNGHGHLAYLLDAPVWKGEMARSGPLRFAAAVQRGLRRRLYADPHYSGLITKNPLHPAWCTEWLAPDPYDLPTLESWLFERDMRLEPSLSAELGLGRNCHLFDELRHVAYHEVRRFKADGDHGGFARRIDESAFRLNHEFLVPLGLSEVRSIARSVTKWTWRRFTPSTFSKIQALRGGRMRRTTKNRLEIVERLANDKS